MSSYKVAVVDALYLRIASYDFVSDLAFEFSSI